MGVGEGVGVDVVVEVDEGVTVAVDVAVGVNEGEGVIVDDGIHVIHRFRENPDNVRSVVSGSTAIESAAIWALIFSSCNLITN